MAIITSSSEKPRDGRFICPPGRPNGCCWSFGRPIADPAVTPPGVSTTRCVTSVKDSVALPSFQPTVSRTSRTPDLSCSPSTVSCCWIIPTAAPGQGRAGQRAWSGAAGLGARRQPGLARALGVEPEQPGHAAVDAGERLEHGVGAELQLRLDRLQLPGHLGVALVLEGAALDLVEVAEALVLELGLGLGQPAAGQHGGHLELAGADVVAQRAAHHVGHGGERQRQHRQRHHHLQQGKAAASPRNAGAAPAERQRRGLVRAAPVPVIGRPPPCRRPRGRAR